MTYTVPPYFRLTNDDDDDIWSDISSVWAFASSSLEIKNGMNLNLTFQHFV